MLIGASSSKDPATRAYHRYMAFLIDPPIEPMLAKPTPEIPAGDGWCYEPKWDGFRALAFRDGDELLLQSRDLKPLNRYFPELEAPLRALGGPDARFVLDGEVVIARPDGRLDFDALLLRIHPAESRVRMLAAESPASFVAFDCLAEGDEALRDRRFSERRTRLEQLATSPPDSVLLTPMTTDPATARRWFDDFEGAGLDGVVAKRADGVYAPGKREMAKIKHARTADCVVAGFRWHKNGPGTMIGSLLLGLYNDAGDLQHVGVTSSFTLERPPAGTAARICRGSRSESSSCARSRSITCRATASGMARPSCAGGPTARRPTAATTSWPRRRRRSSRTSSAPDEPAGARRLSPHSHPACRGGRKLARAATMSAPSPQSGGPAAQSADRAYPL
jgi:ATP-dependent DNA ligase